MLATEMVQNVGLAVQEALAARLPVAVFERLLVEMVVEEMGSQVFQCIKARCTAGPFALGRCFGPLVAMIRGIGVCRCAIRIYVDILLLLISLSFLDGG